MSIPTIKYYNFAILTEAVYIHNLTDMWLSLSKPSLWAQKLKHTFHPFLIAKPTNNSSKGLRLLTIHLLWLLSEAS